MVAINLNLDKLMPQSHIQPSMPPLSAFHSDPVSFLTEEAQRGSMLTDVHVERCINWKEGA